MSRPRSTSGPAGAARWERSHPAELVAMAFGVGIFVGLVVLLGSRSPTVSVIFAGIAFIVTLLLLAMLALVASGSPAPSDRPVLHPPEDEHSEDEYPGDEHPGDEHPGQ